MSLAIYDLIDVENPWTWLILVDRGDVRLGYRDKVRVPRPIRTGFNAFGRRRIPGWVIGKGGTASPCGAKRLMAAGQW